MGRVEPENAACSPYPSAVKRLCDIGVLAQTSGEQRNRIFSYVDYLDLLRVGT
jgi:hypothetical protein